MADTQQEILIISERKCWRCWKHGLVCEAVHPADPCTECAQIGWGRCNHDGRVPEYSDDFTSLLYIGSHREYFLKAADVSKPMNPDPSSLIKGYPGEIERYRALQKGRWVGPRDRKAEDTIEWQEWRENFASQNLCDEVPVPILPKIAARPPEPRKVKGPPRGVLKGKWKVALAASSASTASPTASSSSSAPPLPAVSQPAARLSSPSPPAARPSSPSPTASPAPSPRPPSHATTSTQSLPRQGTIFPRIFPAATSSEKPRQQSSIPSGAQIGSISSSTPASASASIPQKTPSMLEILSNAPVRRSTAAGSSSARARAPATPQGDQSFLDFLDEEMEKRPLKLARKK